MAMEVGSKKGGAMATMNVVPLIDILLVLLIIFMVITPVTPKGLNTLVPQPAPPNSKPDMQANAKTIVVQVLANNKLKINDEDVTWEGLGSRIFAIFAGRAEKIAFIKGDESVDFATVATAIDIIRNSGVDKVGLITNKLETSGN